MSAGIDEQGREAKKSKKERRAEERAAEEAARAAEQDFEARLAEAEDRYVRALADFQNFQRRSVENERRANEAGVVGAVERLLPVLDNMTLAMDSAEKAEGGATPEQVVRGVRSIIDEFRRALSGMGVEPIEPAPNDAFEPGRHEAVMQAPAAGVEAGAVGMTLQTGYAKGEWVIRPAKVSVATAPPEGAGAGGDA